MDDLAGQGAPDAGEFGAAETQAPPPFTLILPRLQMLPVIVSSPHSGRFYPPEFLAASRLDALAIRRSEDFLVDELFAGAPAQGCCLIAANYPRAYLDLNREPYELDPQMFRDPLPAHANTRSQRVTAGLGAIPRVVREGAEIYREKLSFAEAERRLRSIHAPYHAALQALIETTLARFGCAILLDAHSMPSCAGAEDRDFGLPRADVVLGDRFGASCAGAVTRAAERSFAGLGFRTQRNHPYAGGYSTEIYGRPRAGVHALQVEINRALYMDEERIARGPGFSRLKNDLRSLLMTLGALDLASLRPPRAA